MAEMVTCSGTGLFWTWGRAQVIWARQPFVRLQRRENEWVCQGGGGEKITSYSFSNTTFHLFWTHSPPSPPPSPVLRASGFTTFQTLFICAFFFLRESHLDISGLHDTSRTRLRNGKTWDIFTILMLGKNLNPTFSASCRHGTCLWVFFRWSLQLKLVWTQVCGVECVGTVSRKLLYSLFVEITEMWNWGWISSCSPEYPIKQLIARHFYKWQ